MTENDVQFKMVRPDGWSCDQHGVWVNRDNEYGGKTMELYIRADDVSKLIEKVREAADALRPFVFDEIDLAMWATTPEQVTVVKEVTLAQMRRAADVLAKLEGRK